MNRQEQYKFIEAFFPDALINPEEQYLDQPGVRYDLHNTIGFCDCGDPGGSATWLRDLLVLLDVDAVVDWELRSQQLAAHWKKVVTTDEVEGHYGPIFYIICYMLSDREWTRHGGSVPGWTTPKGRAAIEVLNLLIEEEEETNQ